MSAPTSAAVATPGALEASAVAIVEGPICALSMAAAGTPAIALCGTNAPTWLVKRLAFRRVAVAFDADTAGDAAAPRLIGELRSFGAQVERWRPTGVKDWNDLLLRRLCLARRCSGFWPTAASATDFKVAFMAGVVERLQDRLRMQRYSEAIQAVGSQTLMLASDLENATTSCVGSTSPCLSGNAKTAWIARLSSGRLGTRGGR